jgi:DNA repair exonuclease SbcCD ATPase subunit
MADAPAAPAEPTEPAATTEQPTDDQRVPYERFEQVNKKAKEAAERATTLETQLKDLKAQLDDRESAGLPELDRLKKDMERVQKRADEAEARAAAADTKLQRTSRERLITAAAQAQNFADPSDASAFIDLDAIEDEKDAERAVKRLASQKKHLLKVDEPTLPGLVLKDGKRTEKKPGDIDVSAEAQMLADGLKQFASK